MPESVRDTIARVAREEGEDPAYALATAERESSFNPNAGGTGSIRGLYQLTGKNRRAVGQAEDAGTEDQVRGFVRFTGALRKEMRGVLGRDPTPGELYLGHHWGGVRAANVVAGRHRDLAPGDFFTPLELAGNPHLARGSSVGQLADSITGDITRRHAKFGGQPAGSGSQAPNFADFGQPADAAQPGRSGLELLRPAMKDWTEKRLADLKQQGADANVIDFSTFGQPLEPVANETTQNMRADMRPGVEVDLSQFGQTQPQQPLGAV